jgi:RNA polymerase sigma-70 factor, ECF subfamily
MEESDLIYTDAHKVTDNIGRSVQRELFFRTVYEEYKKPLGAFLYRLLAQKYEMEDLYQEVLTKFWRHLETLHKLPTTEETKKWLFTVARNQAIDRYRKQSKLLSEPLEEAEQTLCEATLMEDQLCELERLQWVLTHMSPTYRICLVLQDLYGYSQKKIAALLNISEKTVSTNVLRGRKQLLALLDDVRRKKEEEGDDSC